MKYVIYKLSAFCVFVRLSAVWWHTVYVLAEYPFLYENLLVALEHLFQIYLVDDIKVLDPRPQIGKNLWMYCTYERTDGQYARALRPALLSK